MQRKDMHSHSFVAGGLGPVAANADANTGAIDLAGFMAAEILIGLGIGGITFSTTNKIEIVVEDSDDGSTFAAVDQVDILGATVASGGIVKAFTAAHAAAADYRVGYVGGKRYVRVSADFSGTHGTATPIHVAVVGLSPMNTPAANQA